MATKPYIPVSLCEQKEALSGLQKSPPKSVPGRKKHPMHPKTQILETIVK
jgi:hypothetical protein